MRYAENVFSKHYAICARISHDRRRQATRPCQPFDKDQLIAIFAGADGSPRPCVQEQTRPQPPKIWAHPEQLIRCRNQRPCQRPCQLPCQLPCPTSLPSSPPCRRPNCTCIWKARLSPKCCSPWRNETACDCLTPMQRRCAALTPSTACSRSSTSIISASRCCRPAMISMR